ncbi:MAG: sensor histidine kinase [Candidatus Geothermincolia bacterium]
MPDKSLVLVIEDDRDFADNLRDILEENGLEVALALDGSDGIEAAAREHPDLILLDLRLPDIPGIDVIRQIRKAAPEVEFIVETGYGSMDTAVQALEIGAFSYITKPLDPAQLLHLCSRAIERGNFRRLLEESEETYRTFFENSPHGIIVSELDGAIVWHNSAAAALFATRDGAPFRGTLTGLLGEEEAATALRVLSSGDKNWESTRMGPFGEPMTLEGRINRIHIRGGEYFQLIFSDITARKAAEQMNLRMIRDLEQLNRVSLEVSRRDRPADILEVVLAGALRISGMRAGYFRFADRSGEVLCEGCLGWPSAPVVPEELVTQMTAAFDRGEAFVSYGPGSHPAGLDWDAVSAVLGAYVAGMPITAMGLRRGFLLGVSDEKNLDAGRVESLNTLSSAVLGIALERADYQADLEKRLTELEEAYRRLETLELLKGNILATVSHELRTPLTLIKGYTNTLFEHWDSLGVEQRDHMEDIINSRISKLNRLIGNLVVADRLRSPGIKKAEVRVDLVPLLDRAVSQLTKNGDGARIKIVSPPRLMTTADPDLLEMIIENLLSNAAKFSPEGGGITVKLDNGSDSIRIVVKDEGVGIAADQLERIFDSFYQVESGADRRFQGVGLGLFIAKQLALAVGGDVTVESKEREGSTFTLWIPR